MARTTSPTDCDAHCSLAINAQPRLAPVVRLFVGSVVREWGGSEEQISDLRLGAFELAVAAMDVGPDEILIETCRGEDRIVMTVSPLRWGDVPETTRDVIEGLFDDVLANGDAVALTVELDA